jgi:transcriptional regulator with XRE-family HTH domain
VNASELKRCQDMVAKVVENLGKIRETNHVSKNELSQLSGLSRSAILRIETSLRQPTLNSLFRLSRALGIDLWKVVKAAEQSQKN